MVALLTNAGLPRALAFCRAGGAETVQLEALLRAYGAEHPACACYWAGPAASADAAPMPAAASGRGMEAACVILEGTAFFAAPAGGEAAAELLEFLRFYPMVRRVQLTGRTLAALPGCAGFAAQTAPWLRLEEDGALPAPAGAPAQGYDDWRAIHALLRENLTAGEFDAFYADMHLRQRRGAARAWLLRTGGVPASCVCAFFEGEKVAALGGVATAPAFRRRGFASALLARACGALRADGKTPLLCPVDAAAGRLYASLGFAPFDARVTLERRA